MRVALATLVLSFLSVSYADTRRIAIIVGNNEGAGDRPALHYAESDAQKIAGALGDLGGIDPENLYVLRGAGENAVRRAFASVHDKIQKWHRIAGMRVVLMFFFSGHSDGEALELGRERLVFADLRGMLSSVGADVRVAIVDSCKSGALLATKGGRLGPPFAIRLNDDVAATGEALLTSSAADEAALESREIRGSFFTHHLVSALRGAGDSSGDGRVTLEEAYHYAFARTVSATANTVVGPQHPAYDYKLSGQGDLVLTELARTTAALVLPPGFERIVVQERTRGEVLAEVPSGLASRVALRPGVYDVRGWHDHRVYVAQATLALNETRTLTPQDMQPSASTTSLVKGGDAERRPLGIEIAAAGGIEDGIAVSVPIHGGVRLSVRGNRPSTWTASIQAATGKGSGFWETDAFALGGYRLGLQRARLLLWGGLEAGAGLIAQNVAGGPTLQSFALLGAPEIGAQMRITDQLRVGVEGQLLLGWFRKDASNAFLLSPSVWLGVSWLL